MEEQAWAEGYCNRHRPASLSRRLYPKLFAVIFACYKRRWVRLFYNDTQSHEIKLLEFNSKVPTTLVTASIFMPLRSIPQELEDLGSFASVPDGNETPCRLTGLH